MIFSKVYGKYYKKLQSLYVDINFVCLLQKFCKPLEETEI